VAERLPEHLREEATQVEEQIRRAFHGVTRDGGLSWSGALVADRHGSPEEIVAAAAQDKDSCWEDLVDDPDWDEEPGMGGFNFLDPIGYRYYIAPAMIRCTRRGYGEFVGYALEIDGPFREEVVSAITEPQARAIARFVRFMIVTHAAEGDEIYGDSWRVAYRLHWRRF
jgi:hypothetical protein